MAINGGFKKLMPSEAGNNPVILTGDVYDSIIAAINMFAEMEVSPKSNCGRLIANEKQFVLDLSEIDGRLNALSTGTGIGSVNTIVNNTPTISITQQISNIEARLDAATASVNCVANVAVVTFTI